MYGSARDDNNDIKSNLARCNIVFFNCGNDNYKAIPLLDRNKTIIKCP